MELSHETMKSMEALAQTNIKISEAKNLLTKLQEEETEYLIEREKKALSKIEKAYEESRDLIKQTDDNYEKIKELHNTVAQVCNFITESYEKLGGLRETFNKRSDLWEREYQRQCTELGIIKKDIETQQKRIKKDEEGIEEKRKGIEEQKALIESRQQQLSQAYEKEKELWNKLK